MSEYRRDQYIGTPVEMSEHLLSKGLECSTRTTDDAFFIIGAFTEAALDAALADFAGQMPADVLLQQHIESTGLNMTRDQYNAVRAQIQNLRELRQMGRNAFMTLTAAERDRLIYDAMTSVTVTLLSILRDES